MASASDNRPAMKAKEVANRFSGNLQITVARKPAEMEDALSVRRAVFIEEQGVPEAEEIDTYDGDPGQATGAVHVVAYLDEQPLATGRLLLDALPGENAHIGRVAVLRQHRRRGLGRTVTLALHREAQRRSSGRCRSTSASATAPTAMSSLTRASSTA